ncbi:hypothetical protein [Rhizobium sp. R693]|nr:hypothetical protein [Rhizobium sp. R693]
MSVQAACSHLQRRRPNRGVAKALENAGKADESVFVGHKLTNHSHGLLE